MIANRYDQQLNDVQEWLSITEWSQENLTNQQVEKVQDKLLQLDLIEEKVSSSKILK